MTTLILNPDNSAFVQITLTNPVAGGPVNDATVTGRIDNLDDTVLVSTFSMPYVAASSGVYRATLIPIAGLELGVTYKVVIDSVGADSLIGHWLCNVQATEAEGC